MSHNHNNNNKNIRILVADDKELVSIGLQTVFEHETDLEVVGVADNFEDLLRLCQEKTPDLILFDCMLNAASCIERIPELLILCPCAKLLILTACLNRERHLLALRQGAHGVFTLNLPVHMLIKAIHRVHAGEVWLNNVLSVEMLKGFSKPDSPPKKEKKILHHLTTRELTIARLSATGMTAKQIGTQLAISEKTIRNHLVIIYSKLGVRNHLELVLHAPALGLQE